ncbi:MAG TPA: hypothetical protein VG204_21305 [Terriglobia bacterium]|nr:hypothetical protein [Terriglobia bacterium]
MTSKFRTGVNLLLVFLVILDLALSSLCLFAPATWFKIMHGAPYVDPEGLLRRTGAVWAAFTLLQLVALVRWRKKPYWLVLVAGVRLTEIFSDWTYLYFAASITTFGRLGLMISPPANVIFGWLLIRAYLRLERDSKSGT